MNYNIGILVDSLYDEYENKLWYELVEYAKTRDVNVVTFVGGAIHSPFEQNSKRNVVYNLVSKENINGIISLSALIAGFATGEELHAFLQKFAPIPIVNIGVNPPGSPAILIDNEKGIRQLMNHMIGHHHYKHIAFIKGPDGNVEADLRFRVYQTLLKENNLPVAEKLIVQGDFCRISGVKAIATLLDERKVSFDSVVAANDYMAIDAMKELQNRGIRVPEDIAVVGFDDLHESSCLMHPLTTVRQPIFDIAKNAIDTLINLLDKKPVNQEIVLPAKLVVRRSCGCFFDIVHKNIIESSRDMYDLLLDSMNRNLAESLDHETKLTWVNRLIKNFEASLEMKNQKVFLINLEEILIQSNQKSINILTWYPVISALFSNYQKHYHYDQLFHLLWKGSLIVIGNLAKQAQAHIQIFKNVQNYQLHLLYEAFRNIFDLKKQKIFMDKYLPELKINSFYLGLFNNSYDTDHVKLLIAYENGSSTEADDNVLSIHTLLQNALSATKERKVLVVLPIYSDHEQLGITINEDGPQDGIIYEGMGAQLNLSIYEAKLFKQVQEHAQDLELQVEERTRELKRLNKELELKSKLDGLTNLYNRTAIYEFLENKLTSQKVCQWISDKTFYELNRRTSDKTRHSSHSPVLQEDTDEDNEPLNFSIIMLDIDHFKKINDTYGHLFGDKVLRTLSFLLQAPDIFRKKDLAGRYGGEEFIVILPNTELKDAFKVADRFKKRLNHTPIEYDKDSPVAITVSMGISRNLPDDIDNEAVIYRADKALYYAKDHGRNRIIIYSEVFQ